MTRRAVTIALGASALLAIAILLAGPPAARRAFAWLDTGEPPCRADLLVVVTGGARERLVSADRLYREGLAPAILITGPEGAPAEAIGRLASAGIPARALISPPGPSDSTVEDAQRIREVVIRRGCRSILAVTSPYHCRRLRLVLSRTMADLDVRICVTASASLYFDRNRWWADEQGWDLVPPEFLKLAWAWAAVPRKPLT